MNQIKFPVYERFYSWQGEGFHSGKSAYFIRTYGCPLKCSWCDSAGTWHKDYVPKEINKFNFVELFDLFNNEGGKANFIVITGGEPTMFDWTACIKYFKQNISIPFHLESSGCFNIQGDFDWITISPKWDKLPLLENIQKCHEIKLIVENENSIKDWIKKFPEIMFKDIVFLNPEWSQINNQKVLNSITQYIKDFKNFRVGYQLHKLFRCDELDSNSKIPVPLGGNKLLGY